MASAVPRAPAGRAQRRAARLPTQLTGYVLHGHDWSESSLILDTFTRELGRTVLVARGAKRPYSQLRPVLMPFQRLLLTIGRPPAAPAGGDELPDIHTLRTAEWAGTHAQPRGAALFAGFYLHELLMRLLARHDPHPALFDAYALAVAHLARDPEPRHPAVLRAFECRLLREIGLLPALDADTLTEEPVEDTMRYAISAELGVTRRASGAPDAATPRVAGRCLRAIEAALRADEFDTLVAACAGDDTDLKPALRQVLHYHLDGSRLRTRDLLRDLNRLVATVATAPAEPDPEPVSSSPPHAPA
jgi:DNA repair protein RecO (recombination protein O)